METIYRLMRSKDKTDHELAREILAHNRGMHKCGIKYSDSIAYDMRNIIPWHVQGELLQSRYCGDAERLRMRVLDAFGLTYSRVIFD